jgi:hypothetical protein
LAPAAVDCYLNLIQAESADLVNSDRISVAFLYGDLSYAYGDTDEAESQRYAGLAKDQLQAVLTDSAATVSQKQQAQSLLSILNSTPAPSETVNALLSRSCSMNARVNALEQRGREEIALNNIRDAAVYYKQAARLNYECSQQTSGEAHDWFFFYYASDLYESAVTNQDGMDIGDLVASQMNELAYSTRYPKIREVAQKLKSVAQQMAADARKAIYGNP